ncbi:thioredoxin family protein [Alicycliphilus denitrificans]|uniref:Thioredoxin n=1 Tax=Alicycliphilus denitrificans TaxID=179636 RepID=A0A420K7E3_9BURK|nr:thioredoxin family protein [Alicycliphilus denitrificans]RKJ94174.1 thioredoxin [Alicycliphilus denitrificans]
MPFAATHLAQPPTREAVDQLQGPAVLEFGTPWCGHCQRAQPLIEQAFKDQDGVQHLKVEDGPGRPLGRSYRVKLWPTLVFLRDGQETARLVRPQDLQDIHAALRTITAQA